MNNDYYDKDTKELVFLEYRMAFGEYPPILMETDPTYKPYLDYLIKCVFVDHKKANADEIGKIYGDSDLTINGEKSPEQEFAEEFKKGE